MICYDFATTTHGKWILAGEHAVLRGHPALVFPVNEKKLTLQFHPSTKELTGHYSSNENEDILPLFWKVLKHGMTLLEQPLDQLHGHFHLQNNIPVGAGMGASAALCVALSRWFAAQNMLSRQDIPLFARELEHLFHGQSSGLDIAGVASSSGIYFQQGIISPVEQTWQPHWYLSRCGETGATSACIKTVQSLWQTSPVLARAIDQQMHDSVLEARESLATENLQKLGKAIEKAADCFQQWGLINNNLKQHMQTLLDAGAIAVKPTGSGGGGFVLSLWENTPPDIAIEFAC